MNYYPNTWRKALGGAEPSEAQGHQKPGIPEARDPMQPHRLHRL